MFNIKSIIKKRKQCFLPGVGPTVVVVVEGAIDVVVVVDVDVMTSLPQQIFKLNLKFSIQIDQIIVMYSKVGSSHNGPQP